MLRLLDKANIFPCSHRKSFMFFQKYFWAIELKNKQTKPKQASILNVFIISITTFLNIFFFFLKAIYCTDTLYSSIFINSVICSCYHLTFITRQCSVFKGPRCDSEASLPSNYHSATKIHAYQQETWNINTTILCSKACQLNRKDFFFFTL